MSKEILAEQIADQLRRDILRGALRPGMPVKERAIADHLGVSRTPIREAIRILSQEGLIELRPSRSPIVQLSDFAVLADQSEVLIALEQLSAKLACQNASNAQIDHIEGILQYMEDSFDSVDPLDMFEVDMSFHTAIAQASGNAALAETHGTFLRRLWHARYLSARRKRNRDRVIEEHTAILKALRVRNPQAAQDAIWLHLSGLAEGIRHTIEHEDTNKEQEGIPQ